MKLTIEIALDNDAFYENQGWETARILSKLASKIREFSHLDGMDETLMDINGKRVGRAEVSDE